MTSRSDESERKDNRKEAGIVKFSSHDPHKRKMMPKEQKEKYGYINAEHLYRGYLESKLW
jgi:hypothetical protein